MIVRECSFASHFREIVDILCSWIWSNVCFINKVKKHIFIKEVFLPLTYSNSFLLNFFYNYFIIVIQFHQRLKDISNQYYFSFFSPTTHAPTHPPFFLSYLLLFLLHHLSVVFQNRTLELAHVHQGYLASMQLISNL